MKMLLYTSVLSGGGAERVLCQLASKLSHSNEVILAASYKTSNEYPVEQNVKKVYIDNSIENKSTIRQINNLRNLIKTEKPKVVISFLPEPNFKMLMSSWGLKTKKIISIRNDPTKEYRTYTKRLLAKLLYGFSDGVVFQTLDAQKWFPQKIQQKSQIIMNQVNDIFFETEHASEDYYVATGRLNKQKNYPMMIRAFSKFLKRFPNEKLYIYGDGDQSELNQLINELGVKDNIILKGNSSDIPYVLSMAKGFILSSDYEGMPNGLLEALAMGVVSIATDCPCGGPREVIEDAENGFLIPVGDEEKLFETLCMIETSVDLRKQISKNAIEKAKMFKPNYIFKQWESYIESLIY